MEQACLSRCFDKPSLRHHELYSALTACTQSSVSPCFDDIVGSPVGVSDEGGQVEVVVGRRLQLACAAQATWRHWLVVIRTAC